MQLIRRRSAVYSLLDAGLETCLKNAGGKSGDVGSSSSSKFLVMRCDLKLLISPFCDLLSVNGRRVVKTTASGRSWAAWARWQILDSQSWSDVAESAPVLLSGHSHINSPSKSQIYSCLWNKKSSHIFAEAKHALLNEIHATRLCKIGLSNHVMLMEMIQH